MYATKMKRKKGNKTRAAAYAAAQRTQCKSDEMQGNGFAAHLPKAISLSRSQAMGNNRVTQAYTRGREKHSTPGQDKHLPHGERKTHPTGLRSLRTPARSAAASPSSGVLQAIMSVADFKQATRGFGKRRRSIGPVDVALATYVGARTIVNANGLYYATQYYLAHGNHSTGRVNAVTGLDQRADAEHQLLVEIGNANSLLVDTLIDQVGIGNIDDLVDLANTATMAHAPHLPALITAAGGAGGLVNLDALIGAVGAANTPYLAGVLQAVGGFGNRAHITNLVAETGAANFMNIPNYIQLSGGMGNIVSLIALLNNNTGHPETASQFLAAANGNGATFTNMSNALPHFAAAAPPPNAPVASPGVRLVYPLPSNLMGMYRHYNERHRAQNFAFNYRNINMTDGQTLWPFPGTTAVNVQNYLEAVLVHANVAGRGVTPGPPVPGSVQNVPVGVGGMQARIRINNPTGGTNYRISQFFPEQGTPGTVHFEGLQMVGIGMVLGHM